MAQNKGAIVRYRAIDRCLRSKHGKYGIEELRAACERSTQMRFAYALNTQKKYWKLPILLKKGKPIMQRYLIPCVTSLSG